MLYDVVVNDTQDEALGIRSFRFVSTGRGPLPPSEPGAHIDVHIRDGLIRQYSLVNGLAETGYYVIGVKHEEEGRGGSHAMFENVRVGSKLQISAPRNQFSLVPKTKHSLLLAGGIGITPILSMARHLDAAGASFEMVYTTHSEEFVAFRELLEEPSLASHISFYHDNQPKRRLNIENYLAKHRKGTHVYMCGPPGFLDACLNMTDGVWPGECVHYERFQQDDNLDTNANTAFRIELKKSRVVLDVPADQTVLDVLLDNDIEADFSCEQGFCGTCVTAVLKGTPDHRDTYFSDEEKAAGDCFTPCVSRSKSDVLVIDK